MAFKLPSIRLFREAGKGKVGNVKGFYKFFNTEAISTDKLEKYEEIYKKVPIVQAAINYTADLAVGTGYSLISEDETAKAKVAEVLDQQDFGLLSHRLTRHLLVYGNAYVEIVKLGNKLVELKLLHPKNMVVEADDSGEIKGYKQELGMGETINFSPEEIAHFKWNVIGDEIYGTSAIESVVEAINVKLQMEGDLRLISHRYAAPQIQYAIGTDAEPATEEQITEFESQLDNQTPEMDLVTSHAVKVNTIRPLSGSIGVEEFLKHMENQVIAGLQVPEVALGRGQNSTEATAKVQLGIFDRRVKAIQRVLTRQTERLIIEPLVGDNVVEIEFGEFEKEDEDVKVNRLLRLKSAGIVTSDYVAKQLDIAKKFIPKEPEEKPSNISNVKGVDDSKKDVNPKKMPMKEGIYYINKAGDIQELNT